jgi:hyperosmotically inducible protein
MTAARITALAVLALATLLFTAGALAQRPARPGPLPATDATLAWRAAEALRADPVLHLQPIRTEAAGDLVILRGAAESPAVRGAAVRAVRAVPGVREVRDEIRVPLPRQPGSSPL